MRAVIAVLLCFLALACMEEPKACERPYTLVNGDCCLDEDADSICDSDKPVCAVPYINVGSSCCLDINENGACDIDERLLAPRPTQTICTTITTTSTSSSTTTSTTVEPKRDCERLEDCPIFENKSCDSLGRAVTIHTTPIKCGEGECIYRSSKEISAYPCLTGQRCIAGRGCVDPKLFTTTTTTLVYDYSFDNIVGRIEERAEQAITTTSTTLPGCTDPDGGKRYDIRAQASGPFIGNKTFISGQDHCTTDRRLREYYCISGELAWRIHECAGDCVDGRCCVPEGNSCSSKKDCCAGDCRSIGLSKYCIS